MPSNEGPQENDARRSPDARHFAQRLGLTGVLALAGLASSCLGGLSESIDKAVEKLAKEVADTRATVATESKDWQTTTGNAIDDAISQLGSSTSDVTGPFSERQLGSQVGHQGLEALSLEPHQWLSSQRTTPSASASRTTSGRTNSAGTRSTCASTPAAVARRSTRTQASTTRSTGIP